MSKAEVQKRIEKLRAELNRHNHLYYVEARPEISDPEYDRLYKELQQLEAEHPELITPDSPTQRVGGAPLKEFKNVRHLVPMLSLQKAETEKDLELFETRVRKELGGEKIEYIVEPKVDGVSIGVHYSKGLLSLGVTRGDGTTGDDITANIRTVRAIPLRLAFKGTTPDLLEVRGEAYMSESDRIAMNEALRAADEKTFANTRNATAGSLKQLDPAIVAKRRLRAVFYGIGAVRGAEFSTHEEELETLNQLGFSTPAIWFKCASMAEAHNAALEMKRRADELPYEIDGVVIKINNVQQCRRLGLKTNAPASAIAYKRLEWAEEAPTCLRDITIQVGRTGVLSPVAEVEPVKLEGTTISRVTLHNADEIRRKDIRIGDQVVIKRAGRVIPAVVRVLDDQRNGKEREFSMPSKCPACGGPVVRKELASSGKPEVASRCENVACPAQRARWIEYFANRNTMDIEALGDVVAEKIVERGLAKDPLDLFEPGFTLDKLSSLNLGTEENPRLFGEKNAAKVFAALERSRSLPLGKWLCALGIPNVGETTAYELGRLHRNIDELANSELLRNIVSLAEKEKTAKTINPRSTKHRPRNEDDKREREKEHAALEHDIEALEKEISRSQVSGEVGPVVADCVLDFFHSRKGQQILHRLKELGIDPPGGTAGQSGPAPRLTGRLGGKKFVVTGTLIAMDRSAAQERIRDFGGEVADSVSSKTDYLVCGSNPGSTKVARAQSLGVKTIEEAEFLKMLGEKPKKAKAPAQGELFS
jgi:DNA ligase (NAD+)